MRQDRKAEKSVPSNSEIKTAWSSASSPSVRFLGVVLNHSINFKIYGEVSIRENGLK